MFQNNMDLTEEQIKAIKNYDKEIQTIEIFADAVRANVGEFLGGLENIAAKNAIREIYSNSVDEMCKPNSPCNYIQIEYFEIINRCIVSDNGRGLPKNVLISTFTKAHTSSNFQKHLGVYSSGLQCDTFVY